MTHPAPQNIVQFPVRAATLRRHVALAGSHLKAMDVVLEALGELHCLLAYCRDNELSQSCVPLGFIARAKRAAMGAKSRAVIDRVADTVADQLRSCEVHINASKVPLPPLFVMERA